MLSPVLKPLSATDKPHRLTVAENNLTTKVLALYVIHIDTEKLDLASINRKFEALTPVNASSLYWLI